ncbi:putative ArsR-family transcriptional regulator [Actinoplanes missouriensis 431]|uniref:Putative ArsR-family transcriptional regulator n=1 Tax=Actinoplanes missouriensis (strain ATCC 14538 / DSM 43046 / CBS 188.64 / JCM 3121 / NBRC 102363 / NCIMB 12654 / NRRL B-3342 / UNCC 431) TaxID=512565 RepID=I0H9C5_ACTM4|nr:helix-turn-helix domain-containing protein [Actinoplanes missouriensis]BAL89612.1 putative ArsR-family transcriptional regulator [Actinoplanes missouriensis 431]
MRGSEQVSLDAVELPAVLDALADPVRLEVIRQLAAADGVVTGSFQVGVTMSTLSHHLKVLLASGIVRVTQEGRYRRCELRLAEVEHRFPGVLTAILAILCGTG